MFIVGSRSGLDHFQFPKPTHKKTNIRQILDKNPKNSTRLSKERLSAIKIWQDIISKIPKKDPLPSFPIWGMEFGATYPFEGLTPNATNARTLSNSKGSFGCKLNGLSKQRQMQNLPSYARRKERKFPQWKIDYIKRNREFFNKYKPIIKPHLKKLRNLPPSWQKFEWNCNGEKRDVFEHVIQFRPSGIRIKRSNYIPALVANTTQIPIIGWEKRFLTIKEAAQLQGMNGIKHPPSDSFSYESFGNAVNVKVVKAIATNLIHKKVM